MVPAAAIYHRELRFLVVNETLGGRWSVLFPSLALEAPALERGGADSAIVVEMYLSL